MAGVNPLDRWQGERECVCMMAPHEPLDRCWRNKRGREERRRTKRKRRGKKKRGGNDLLLMVLRAGLYIKAGSYLQTRLLCPWTMTTKKRVKQKENER